MSYLACDGTDCHRTASSEESQLRLGEGADVGGAALGLFGLQLVRQRQALSQGDIRLLHLVAQFALVERGKGGIAEAAPCAGQPPLQGGDVVLEFSFGHSRAARNQGARTQPNADSAFAKQMIAIIRNGTQSLP